MPVPDEVFSEMPRLSDAALRCLLALIRLSWRFDPKEGNWIHTEHSLSRRDVQETCGLSDEGTRQGLSDLEERGWTEVDRSGRGYRYRLRLGVPTERFTYLPTTLLEKARDFVSTVALRVLLAIFRQTWGWARKETGGEGERARMVYQRWARLSTSDLSAQTGRSETAIKEAVQDLSEEWIGRCRPDQGAYVYRILPEAFGHESIGEDQQEEPSSNPPTANEVPPDRQRSVPPTFLERVGERDKQSQTSKTRCKSANRGRSEPEKNAVPGDTPPENRPQSPQNPPAGGSEEAKSDVDLDDLPPKKQSLARKLINAGVWPERAKECLRRYSEERIEANFELFRHRESEIEDNGAWLCAAITDGYADLQSRSKNQSDQRSSGGSPKAPNHKQKVSAEEKQALVRRCPEVKAAHFHRFRCVEDPGEKQFLYLDPRRGGPNRRRTSKGKRSTEITSGQGPTR